jgi:hypothetical protein
MTVPFAEQASGVTAFSPGEQAYSMPTPWKNLPNLNMAVKSLQ